MNPKLKACSTCGEQIAKDATRCPKCGGRNTVTPWGALILGGLLALFAGIWAWATM
jgi:hypothetical protein